MGNLLDRKGLKTAGWSAQVMELDSWQRLIDLGSFFFYIYEKLLEINYHL